MTTESIAAKSELGSGAMFDGIAGRYDLLNRVMSMGVDQRWRRQLVQALHLPKGARVLDLATGTGDVALMIHKHHADATVLGVDPSPQMLKIARTKAAQADADEVLRFMQGDAQELPFADSAFDASCIAFGIRNVPDRARALREMARVTRSGGRVVVLELTEPRAGLLGPLARFHIRHVVPRIGGALSGSKEYRYLQRSIEAFPAADEFAKTMANNGLRVVEVQPLTFGVCSLFVGERSAA